MKKQSQILISVMSILIVFSALSLGTEENIINKESKAIISGNNQFALDLYQKLSENKGNLFFSPYSISSALAMTYLGAQGQTELQMAKTMHYPTHEGFVQQEPSDIVLDRERFATAFGWISRDLNARGKQGSFELTIANALWPQKEYRFLDSYINIVQKNFDAKLTALDYIKETEKARLTINKWVEQKTNDKIKDLIPKGILNSLTRLVLTNAVYFKGNWNTQFKADQTKDEQFKLLDGNTVTVPMMNQTEEFRYAQTDDLQVLDLPYVDNELSMVILLPQKDDGLPELEKQLTSQNLSDWIGKLRKRQVVVSMPKLKMTSSFKLPQTMIQMGMVDPFGMKADFSDMNGNKDLYITEILHKAFVDINEEGTEAAAATAVVIGLRSIAPRQLVFRADHPFIFMIRDNKTGGILFLGRVLNPKA